MPAAIVMIRRRVPKAAVADGYGPVALKSDGWLAVAAVNVVCQHCVEAPSTITSCAVTGSVSGSAGVWRFAPCALAWILALPSAPAFSVRRTTPSGTPGLFL